VKTISKIAIIQGSFPKKKKFDCGGHKDRGVEGAEGVVEGPEEGLCLLPRNKFSILDLK